MDFTQQTWTLEFSKALSISLDLLSYIPPVSPPPCLANSICLRLCLLNSLQPHFLLGWPFWSYSLESSSKKKSGMILYRICLFFPFSKRSQSCAFCCAVSANTCFIDFSQASSCLWLEGNFIPSYSFLLRVLRARVLSLLILMLKLFLTSSSTFHHNDVIFGELH